jgi:hypothetical protein
MKPTHYCVQEVICKFVFFENNPAGTISGEQMGREGLGTELNVTYRESHGIHKLKGGDPKEVTDVRNQEN